ncbi:hypothetical protein KJ807_05710 [Patescibacteria group bacterium]|nr:hypothetical protein [Patescibacteria group bacterium]
MRNPKKHLSFESLRLVMEKELRGVSDKRRVNQVNYSVYDVIMSGFSMMYFQDLSVLQFQERMKEDQHQSNMETVFKVLNIPKETQMREVTDEVNRNIFRPIFKEYLNRLQRGKHLESYQLFPGTHYVAVDGSQYFGSEKVGCDHCLERKHRGGNVSYSHHILQAAVMHPDKNQVLPLMPEEIRNEDGYEKQDCELNACKRLISNIRKDHPRLGITLGGDGLYAKQPIVEAARSHGMNFILVAKPDDHKIMMEWVNEQNQMGELQVKEFRDDKGRIHRYEWVNHIPLNGNDKPVIVNFFRYFLIVNKSGKSKVTYKNSWVTDFEISGQNVEKLVRGGRCRWKIENECFNTLKNQGYNIEHNYGHGSKNLSFNFLLLTLLAFYFHQIFELTDHLYQTARKKLGSKQHLWENLRSIFRMFIVKSWQVLLEWIFDPSSHTPSTASP